MNVHDDAKTASYEPEVRWNLDQTEIPFPSTINLFLNLTGKFLSKQKELLLVRVQI